MKMNDYISNFTKHLTEALEIGQTTLLSEPHADIHNVLICGLGGSGIGGTIVNDLVSEYINVPISATKIRNKRKHSFAIRDHNVESTVNNARSIPKDVALNSLSKIR